MKMVIFGTVIRTRASMRRILIKTSSAKKEHRHSLFDWGVAVYNTGIFGLLIYRTRNRFKGASFFEALAEAENSINYSHHKSTPMNFQKILSIIATGFVLVNKALEAKLEEVFNATADVLQAATVVDGLGAQPSPEVIDGLLDIAKTVVSPDFNPASRASIVASVKQITKADGEEADAAIDAFFEKAVTVGVLCGEASAMLNAPATPPDEEE